MIEKGIKNSLEIYSYNGKNYKTEAAMKKAKTMDVKRATKENKKQAYHQKHGSEKIKKAVEQRKITKEINKNKGLPAFLGDDYLPSKSKIDKETRKENFLKSEGDISEVQLFRRKAKTRIPKELLKKIKNNLIIKSMG